METGSVVRASGTGSRTMADLLALAAAAYGDRVLVKRKVGDEWQDVTYAQAGDIVREIGLGLIDAGVAPGDRVAILCDTRPEWSYVDFAIPAAGAVVVPIYPTNSPEECEWVLFDSGSSVVVCENAGQLEKVRAGRERLPELRTIVVIDAVEGARDVISLEQLRERGRTRDAGELAARTAAVTPADPYTFIYTSGTTGPPKGCVLSHGNYRSVSSMVTERAGISEGELVYLFLPLAHAFALIVQLVSVDQGATIAYYGGDTKQIVPELMAVKPTYLPSVPRIFEKIYSLAQGQLSAEELQLIREVGGRIHDLEVAGLPVPEELREQFAPVAPKAEFVRNVFGGRLEQAVTGAAPIAKEILEFFWGCGLPVMEGYGMTETATVATTSTPESHRFGTVGKPLPGVEVRIAEDGEILIRGANIFTGYHRNADPSFGAVVDGWLHTGDLGSLDDDGFLSITGRKKDIIITAGGKNLTPANLENDLKQTRWISQAVMHGDRRPYPVMVLTLDEEEIVPWAQSQDPPIEDTSMAALSRDPRVRALVQAEVDRANKKYAQVEQVKDFIILDHDLSQEAGELTPTLKVKRNVVNERYGPLLEELYTRNAGGAAG